MESDWKQRKRLIPRCLLRRRENVISRKDRDISRTGEKELETLDKGGNEESEHLE